MISKALRLASKPIIKRIFYGGFWSVVGEVGTRIFPFLTAILIARILGVEDFGSFAMIQATAGAFSVVGGFGLANMATKYIAEYRYTDKEKASKVITLTLFVAGITGGGASLCLYLCSNLVSDIVLNNVSLSAPLSWASPMLFFTALTGAISGILIGLEKTKVLAKLSAFTALITSCFIITGIYYHGVMGGAIAMMFGSFIHMVLGLYVVDTEVKESGLRIVNDNFLQQSNFIWDFSLPSTLATMMHIPVVWLAQAIIANQESGYEELGLYNAAVKWQTIITFVPMAFSAIYLPIMSSINSEKDYGNLLKATNLLAFINFFSILPLMGAVYYFSDSAMSVFGDGFVAGNKMLVFILILSLMSVLYRVYWQALVSIGKLWVSFWITFVTGLLTLFFTWHFRFHGGLGLIYSMCIVTLLGLLAYIYYLNFYMKKISNK